MMIDLLESVLFEFESEKEINQSDQEEKILKINTLNEKYIICPQSLKEGIEKGIENLKSDGLLLNGQVEIKLFDSERFQMYQKILSRFLSEFSWVWLKEKKLFQQDDNLKLEFSPEILNSQNVMLEKDAQNNITWFILEISLQEIQNKVIQEKKPIFSPESDAQIEKAFKNFVVQQQESLIQEIFLKMQKEKFNVDVSQVQTGRIYEDVEKQIGATEFQKLQSAFAEKIETLPYSLIIKFPVLQQLKKYVDKSQTQIDETEKSLETVQNENKIEGFYVKPRSIILLFQKVQEKKETFEAFLKQQWYQEFGLGFMGEYYFDIENNLLNQVKPEQNKQTTDFSEELKKHLTNLKQCELKEIQDKTFLVVTLPFSTLMLDIPFLTDLKLDQKLKAFLRSAFEYIKEQQKEQQNEIKLIFVFEITDFSERG